MNSTEVPDKTGLGPKLRSVRHYRPGMLAAYGLDRVLRLVENYSPRPLHAVVGALPGRGEPDRAALQAWGQRPETRGLAPRWRPSIHGDPRRGEYVFQERRVVYEGQPRWHDPELPALWLFHLHYLDTATALAAAEPEGQWQEWLTGLLEDHWTNSRPGRDLGWMPFPIAVRLQNLLRTWAILEAGTDGGPAPRLARTLRRHCEASARYLLGRLEWHLRANHLLKELCALVAFGAVWGGVFPRRRLLAMLQRETASQFGPGGGHEERSVRYHLDCIVDLAETRAALGASAPRWLEAAITSGLHFAEALEHPDGSIPLFNDAELDMAHGRSVLSRLLAMPCEPATGVTSFRQEGFASARQGAAHVVFRAGPVSVDHQPGHVHCDQLSFEYSWGGRRIVSNRGTLAYGYGPDRRLSRCTASNSTVQVGDAEQVEVWSGFRVGWRQPGVLVEAKRRGEDLVLGGSFSWRSEVGAEHRRTLTLGSGGSLRIDDHIEFTGPRRTVVSRLWLPEAVLGADGEARWPDTALRIRVDGGTAHLADDEWFPRMGLRRPCVLVTIEAEASGPGPVLVSTTLEPTSVAGRAGMHYQ